MITRDALVQLVVLAVTLPLLFGDLLLLAHDVSEVLRGGAFKATSIEPLVKAVAFIAVVGYAALRTVIDAYKLLGRNRLRKAVFLVTLLVAMLAV